MNKDQFADLQSEEVITLIDEETGIPRSFYIVDVFESEGNRYAALASLEDDFFDDEVEDEDLIEEEYDDEEEFMEESEMLLLRMDETQDGEMFVGITDDTEFERVRKIFEARLEGED